MGHKLKIDRVVIVDCEATCWATKEEQGTLASEIIQIGACSLCLNTGEIEKTKSYIVKPHNFQLSEYCTNLTGLTTKIVKSGMPFKDACNKIVKDFGTKNRVWASYGTGDRKMFESECILKQAIYPFNDCHIDVSILFHLKYFIKDRMSLEVALEKIGKKFEGKQHNADWDAYNTAVLLFGILN